PRRAAGAAAALALGRVWMASSSSSSSGSTTSTASSAGGSGLGTTKTSRHLVQRSVFPARASGRLKLEPPFGQDRRVGMAAASGEVRTVAGRVAPLASVQGDSRQRTEGLYRPGRQGRKKRLNNPLNGGPPGVIALFRRFFATRRTAVMPCGE